jgi:alanyl-tRNA synthetase
MERHQHITLAIKNEEEGFSLTLERGLDNFHNVIEKLLKNGEKIIPGEEAFKLYDTYGFPLDMTELLAREKGFTVEVAGFENAMMEQRGRARAGGKFSLELERETPWVVLNDIAITPVENWQKFVGYDLEQCETEIVKYRQIGQDLEVVVKDTPFYAESGGQVGDSGEIKVQSSKLKVINSYFNEGRIRILKIQWEKGFEALIKAGGTVRLTVDIARRQAIKRNHTATHLLHYALREKLGEHVHQAGSLVHPDYLRFDYTHYQKLDSEVLLDIERKVNCLIMENAPVNAEITKLETARKKGAMALFGEKYGEQVRMVSVGNFSRELCGGTHVRMSGDIGYFRITSETGVSAGVRRIEAITGDNALEMILNERQTVEYFNEVLHSFGSDVREKLDKFVLEKKELEKELVGLRHSVGGLNIEQLLADAMVKDGKKIVAKKVEVISLDGLKDLGDVLREKLKSGIGFLGADIEGKAALVCVVTDDLIALKIEAGRLVKNAVKVIGGGVDGVALDDARAVVAGVGDGGVQQT